MTAPYIQLRTDIRKDERVDALAEIAGYTAVAGERGGRRMAIGALVELWTHCSDRGLQDAPDGCDGYAVSEPVIRHFIGPRGVEAILADGCDELALGVRRPDGLIYLRGTSVTVAHLRTASAGGKARADAAKADVTKRGRGGRYGSSATADVSEQTNAPAGHQPATSRTAADDQPSTSDLRSQIPDPRSEDPEIPSARAIPPSPEHPRPPAPGGPPDHATREAARTKLIAELEQARARVAGQLGVTVPPLLAFDPGKADLAGHLAKAGTAAELDTVIDQARHAIAMAEAETASGEQSFEWFNGAVFSPRNFRRLAGKVPGKPRAPPSGRGSRYPERPLEQPRKTLIL